MVGGLGDGVCYFGGVDWGYVWAGASGGGNGSAGAVMVGETFGNPGVARVTLAVQG